MKTENSNTGRTYIALLRGINVGGKNVIRMENLKQCFVEMGFSDVKTYIQSGNVVFRTQDVDKLKLIESIENQLLKSFASEIKTAVFTADELLEIVENAPEHFGKEPEKFRYDVWFFFLSITANEIIANVRLRDGVDFLQAGKNAIYASRLISEASKSFLLKVNQSPIYKSITVRNWNTTTKLLEMTKNE
jgi:uncharacterized protein (DUF1697 family)